MQRKGLTLLEVLVIILLCLVLIAILLPTLANLISPWGDRVDREFCVSQLNELSSILHLYASENDGRFPPVDDTKNNFIFEADTLCPEYLADPMLVACPSNWVYDREKYFRLRTNTHHPGFSKGDFHPDCLTNMTYIYLGWLVTSEKEAMGFFAVYEELSPERYDQPITVSEGYGNSGGNVIHRLSLDSDKFLLAEANTIYADHEGIAGTVPIMGDQISTNITDFNHYPASQNVLYLDGHVEFYRYDVQSTEFPVSPLSAAIFGGLKREPIPGCDG